MFFIGDMFNFTIFSFFYFLFCSVTKFGAMILSKGLLSTRGLHSSGSICSTVKEVLAQNRNRLFKVARATRRSQTYDDDKIDEDRALAEFNLKKEDLKGLPRPASLPDQRLNLYYTADVYNKALKVHGSISEIYAQRRRLLGISNRLSDAEKMRLRMQLEARANTTAGADRVVFIALACNAIDTCCKFGAAYLTGSKSLFAEAIHSTMDTVNQMILYLGLRFSTRNPDPHFPYGYGNMRYITSLISGCGILSFGCGLSIYHGVSGLLHPTELEPLGYAFAALGLSFCFQSFSLFNAYREVRHKAERASMSVLNYVRVSGDPGLNVVFLEDTAAVAGVMIALCAVSASSVLGSSIYDCCGSIAIGVLLGSAAMFIIRTNAVHLVGRALPQRITDDITASLLNDKMIRSVHDVKTTSLGVEKSRFKAEIDFNGREITRSYLRENCNLPVLYEAAKNLEDEKMLEEFMMYHGEKIIDKLGDEVDRLEQKITNRHPDIRHVDLESM